MININFINQHLDDSLELYINHIDDQSTNYYRIFDNNDDSDRIIINGKIDKLINQPKNINNILNIDIECGNIVHIPMLSDMYLEYSDIKQYISIKSLNHIYDSKYYNEDNDYIKFLSVKSKKNLIYRDIIIETQKGIILVQLYKFKLPIDGVSHGAVIIYQNDISGYNQSNTIFYTKDNLDLKLSNIESDRRINIKKTKDQILRSNFKIN